MASKKEREAWTKVLQLLRELSFLYDKQDKLYNNRAKRKEGYDRLLKVYNDITGEGRKMPAFKKKLDNMRTTYTKEMKKVYISKKEGAGSDDIYEPTLWYYPLFDFLEGVALEPSHAEVYIFDECPELLELQEQSKIKLEKRGYGREDSVSSGSISPTSKKQRLTQTRTEEMLGTSKKLANQEEDWDVIGRAIGVQMRDIDKHQLIIVQKIISDAIFYGKMGKLTENSSITLHSENPL